MQGLISKINTTTRLRPIRFGFLVRPTDMLKLENILTVTTCLWGGKYNPIIPYFEKVPVWWCRDKRIQHMGLQLKARSIINGYLEFFEPDFIVEAERGLARKLGIKDSAILQLEDLLCTEEENINKERWGLNTFELYKALHTEEFKFVRHHKTNIISVTSVNHKYFPFIAAVFGKFPQTENLRYIERAYMEALGAQEVHLDAQKLIELYKNNILAPLDVGSKKIKTIHSPSDSPTLFVLDATKPQDLIDFWNFRIIEKNVWAIPIQWLGDLASFCKDFIEKHHIPLPGNPHGVMIKTTLQFSRSINESKIQSIHEGYFGANAVVRSSEYPHIWEPPLNDLSPKRPLLDAGTKEVSAEFISKDMKVNSISPDFVEERGLNYYRWANVVQLRDFTLTNEIATTALANLNIEGFYEKSTFDLFTPIRTSTEGFVCFPRYKNTSNYIEGKSGTKMFTEWMASQGKQVKVSDAGKTTAQMIKTLGGLEGITYIAHPEIIKCLNRMAHKQEIVDGHAN